MDDKFTHPRRAGRETRIHLTDAITHEQQTVRAPRKIGAVLAAIYAYSLDHGVPMGAVIATVGGEG
jgi:hypothetical protein